MENRFRTRQVKFRVTDEEYAMIAQKAKLSQLSMTHYLRKMTIQGIIIKQDLKGINSLISEINRIGTNINQIARRANEVGGINNSEINEVRNRVSEIWQLLKSTLLDPQLIKH